MLLPSTQRDSEDFDDLASRLAVQGFRVLRPQPPGMGHSRGPMGNLSLHALARDVAFTVERLGGGLAVLVGHTYGHFVARVADMNHPDLVRGVVVLGGAAKTFPAGMIEALAVAANPQPADHRPARPSYSAGMLARLTTAAHFSVSLRISAAKSCGLLRRTSMPASDN